MSKRYVIIGASAAGIGAANKLRQLDPDATIVCIAKEHELPYNTCLLADYALGEVPSERLCIMTPERAAQKNIIMMCGQMVTMIDTAQKFVVCQSSEKISYDYLFVATGTSPLIPAIDGMKGVRGVYTFHTLSDTNMLLAALEQRKPRTAVVVGAGLSGLECADVLRSHDVNVHVVERADRVLSHAIDTHNSTIIEQAMREHGVALHRHDEVVRVIAENGLISQVFLRSGVTVQADMLVWAIGGRPNSMLAHEAGIVCQQGSIVVDEYMRTSNEYVYAGGDVVRVRNQVSGQMMRSCMWPDAMLQGATAAQNMLGAVKKYQGAVPITSSAFFGLKFAACGPVANPPRSCEVVRREQAMTSQTLILEKERLRGFCTIGPSLNMAPLRRAILTGQPFAPSGASF